MNRRELLKLCKSLSLTVEDGKKHMHIRDPDGRLVAVAPKGARASNIRGHQEKNLRAALRRASLNHSSEG